MNKLRPRVRPCGHARRLENEPSEANKQDDAESGKLPQPGSVAATVASTEKRRSSGTSESAVPASPVAAAVTGSTGTTAKYLTKDTTRGGEFAPAVTDPSGTKGSELKHPPGSVRCSATSWKLSC